MHSLEYTTALLPGIDLTSKVRPCVIVIRGRFDQPGDDDIPSQVMLVDKPLMLVGRDSTSTIRITDRFVSRYHAALTRLDRENKVTYWLRDGDGRDKLSANGVFVNNERLVAPYQLHDQDRIRFGTRVLASFHEVREPVEADYKQQEGLMQKVMEAGLITPSQLEEAQAEEGAHRLLPSEQWTLKGWLKPETIDFLLHDKELIEALPVASQQPIGEYLKMAGLLTETQVIEALRLQKQRKIYFGSALVEKEFISEDTLNFFLRYYGHLTDFTSVGDEASRKESLNGAVLDAAEMDALEEEASDEEWVEQEQQANLSVEDEAVRDD